MLLDAETLMPAAASHLVVGELPSGVLKTELHASVVELATPVCGSVDEAISSLSALRAEAARRASQHGLVVAAAGSHPAARLESLPVVQEERYLSMIRDIGWAARRQGVNGLHVHVGVESRERCWERLEAVLGWLPAVLAVSCNSPFLDGEETGMLSNRAAVLAELPRGGAPPSFASFAEWRAWVDRLVALGVMDDYTRLWWDARPHPRLGTLEIRIADQPTSLERAAFVVELVVRLVREAPSAVTPRGDYVQNRWAAARGGVDAPVIHPDGSRVLRVRELLSLDDAFEVEAAARLDAAQLVDRTLRF